MISLLSLGILASLGLFWLPVLWLKGIAILIWSLTIISLIFFRDPHRIPPADPLAIISPADGKVVAIQPIEQDYFPNGRAVCITIFLSIFNVHVQRVPADARVEATTYQHGKFEAAFKKNIEEKNEQAVTHFLGNRGKFILKQIAGILARRIVCYMAVGQSVERGDRLGYIRFGSRVDLILPEDVQLGIKIGQRVRGSTTIIGYFA
ncbi:phosphatidylserine decarboxylase [Candidatus Neomarinimicrobiota bacterium]